MSATKKYIEIAEVDELVLFDENIKYKATITSVLEDKSTSVEEVSRLVGKLPLFPKPTWVMKCIEDFKECMEKFRWSETKALTNFTSHLEGFPKTDWKGLIYVDPNATKKVLKASNFQRTLDLWLVKVFVGLDSGEQKDYLKDVARKPRHLSPSQYLQRVELLSVYALKMLNKDPEITGQSVLTKKELVRSFLRSMPRSWYVSMIGAGTEYNPNTIDISTAVAYMDQQYTNLDQAANAGASRDERSVLKTSKNPSRSTTGGAKKDDIGNQTNSKSGRTKADDPCPLKGHAGHTWGQCFQNRFGQRATQTEKQAENRPSWNPSSGGSRTSPAKPHQYFTRSKSKEAGESHAVAQIPDKTVPQQPEKLAPEPESVMSESYQSDLLWCQPVTPKSLVDNPESLFNQFDNWEPERCEGKNSFVSATPEVPENGCRDPESEPDRQPTTLLTCRKMGERDGQYVLRALLDHGGSHVMLNRRCVPPGLLSTVQENTRFATTAGKMEVQEVVYLYDSQLPEFSATRSIQKIKCFIFDSPHVEHDIILGRSFLNSCKVDVLSSKQRAEWCGQSVPFHPPGYFHNNEVVRSLLEVSPFCVDKLLEAFATTISESKSTKADVNVVAQAQKHLTKEQRDQLLRVLLQFDSLFSGKLGTYPHRKFKIHLKPGAQPFHVKRPYPVPFHLWDTVKAELDKQVAEGSLEKVYDSQWGMPAMAIAKKSGEIRIVDDFRELNKVIERAHYVLPRIQDIFLRRIGYKFFTKIDLSQCFYTYVLDDESTWYCVIVTPFGKYRRKRLPMGLAPSPDWAQATLEEVLAPVLNDGVEVYIDDIGVFSASGGR